MATYHSLADLEVAWLEEMTANRAALLEQLRADGWDEADIAHALEFVLVDQRRAHHDTMTALRRQLEEDRKSVV